MKIWWKLNQNLTKPKHKFEENLVKIWRTLTEHWLKINWKWSENLAKIWWLFELWFEIGTKHGSKIWLENEIKIEFETLISIQNGSKSECWSNSPENVSHVDILALKLNRANINKRWNCWSKRLNKIGSINNLKLATISRSEFK